jgi:hypothetical protein
MVIRATGQNLTLSTQKGTTQRGGKCSYEDRLGKDRIRATWATQLRARNRLHPEGAAPRANRSPPTGAGILGGWRIPDTFGRLAGPGARRAADIARDDPEITLRRFS